MNLHDTMIYQKQNPMPLNANRYENAFEYMFVFSNGKPKTVNLLKDKSKTAGITNHGTYYRPNGTLVKKTGSGKVVKEEKVRSNIWTFPVGHSQSGGHPAAFPLKLAQDHILTWSNVGDSILDPFAGSGTTGVAAKYLNRHFTLIEISPKYVEIIKNRLAQEKLF